MKINKDTVVKNLSGFKNIVKFGELVIVLSEVFNEGYDLDEMICSLNDYGEIEEDNFYITSDENQIDYSNSNNISRRIFSKVLAKLFQEEVYVMESDRFTMGKYIGGYSGHTAIDEPTFRDMNFVTNNIYSSDEENILSEITKDHSENEIRQLTINNFFQSHEKELFERLKNKDDIECCYDACDEFYYIKKKDFNKDKWWLGWTSEND